MDPDTRRRIVKMIVGGEAESALHELSAFYEVDPPLVRVGKVKGHAKSQAVYVAARRTIFFSSRETLTNPVVVLHEFYHHLRSNQGKHRGTEKYADRFAIAFIK